MTRRKWWFIALSLALLAACVGVWKLSERPPLPSFIASYTGQVELIAETGYFSSEPNIIVGTRTYAVHIPAEQLLPELEKVGRRLSCAYFLGAASSNSRRFNGIPVEIATWADKSEERYHLVPARPTIDRGSVSESLDSAGWSTVYVFWRRPLTPAERALRGLHVPWEKWRFGKEKPLLFIKDRTSKVVEAWNMQHPAWNERIAEDPAGPGLTDPREPTP